MKKYVNLAHKYRKIVFLVIILAFIIGIVAYGHQKKNIKLPEGRKSGYLVKISATSTNIVKPTLNSASIVPASFSIDGKDGSVRILGIKIVTIENNQIITSGSINNTPTIFVLSIDKNTIIKKGNTTTSVKSLKVGGMLFVTGTLQSFTPDITIFAKSIKFFAQ